jgi:DNA mismatch repair protein MutS2
MLTCYNITTDRSESTIMDEKSLEMLEFHRIREILAGFTSFLASRELAINLQCFTDREYISLLLRQSAEARQFLAVEPNFTVGEVVDTREEIGMAARGIILESQVLIDTGQTLAIVRRLRNRISHLSDELPLLWDMAGGIVQMHQLEDNIVKCLSPDGEVLDSASPQLAAVRRQLRNARQTLRERLEGIIKSARGRRIVQEPIITEREGRYVIPIKIESRRDIRGIIHDVSNTGATAFIEPWTAVEMGNELRELIVEEQREIERVLRILSEKVGNRAEDISNNITLAANIDLVLAKARYARRNRGSEARLIELEDEGPAATGSPVLRLVEARHPLLGDKAVPLSLEMGRDFSILVITGPNTGGKTVALKTIGLLSLMTQAGLPIPASEETCLPIFDGVFVDIGDEQSIEQTLSTFSWHMGNIIRIIGSATNHSLVLLDELGTSTDPAQGSALARAILLHFLSQGTMTVATTHYGDLKAFAHTTPGLQNASLDFDPATFAPMYHLTTGIPGGSNALATAARLGLPSYIIEEAQDMLAGGTREMETLITDLTAEKEKAQSLSIEAEQLKKKAEQQNTELESRLKRLSSEERAIIQEARDKVVREAAELQKEIRQSATQLRKERNRETIEQSRRALSAAREQLRGEVWQPGATGETTGPDEPGSIAPGDTVWLREANIAATVLSISEETQQIEVQSGLTRIRLGLDGVTRVTGQQARSGTGAPKAVSMPPARSVPPELHLLGKHADEAEWEVNSYLDSAVAAGLTQVRIVHGSGTGILRNIVRDMLNSHPLVRSFRPGERGEGGNGATIAQL